MLPKQDIHPMGEQGDAGDSHQQSHAQSSQSTPSDGEKKTKGRNEFLPSQSAAQSLRDKKSAEVAAGREAKEDRLYRMKHPEMRAARREQEGEGERE